MKWKDFWLGLVIELSAYIAALVYLNVGHSLTRLDAVVIAFLVIVSHNTGKYIGRQEITSRT